MRRTPVSLDIESFPEALSRWLKDAAVFDSSCSEAAGTYYLEKDGGCFLKTSAADSLQTEAVMTSYYHTLGLSAEVLYYGTENGKDYLLTRRLPGEDCTWAPYRAEPKRLCDTAALLLRQLHETPAPDCPVPDRNESYAAAVKRGLSGHVFEPEHFRGLWEFSSREEAEKAAEEGLCRLDREVLLHGDYCLPNIILDRWKFSGFIDLGQGGIGDRHIDILWGIWTLNRNLKTVRYTDRFIDVYGKELVDREKLRLIAAMEIIGGE